MMEMMEMMEMMRDDDDDDDDETRTDDECDRQSIVSIARAMETIDCR